MLFQLAIAMFVSIQVPTTHGHGLVRRISDNSIVEPTVESKLKSGKAEKGKSYEEDYREEPLSMIDTDESASSPFANLTPEPRSVSIENKERPDDHWNNGATSISSTNGGTIKFDVPEDTQVGDTLFLFLSRSDSYLPLHIDQWTRGTECFKSFNKQDVCMRAAHCVKRDGPYCLQFDNESSGGDGRDLATVVFYRHVEEEDPGCWTLDLRGKTTVWAIVTAIPNVNRVQPIFRTNGTSCDVSTSDIQCLYRICVSSLICFYSTFSAGLMGECVPLCLRVSSNSTPADDYSASQLLSNFL